MTEAQRETVSPQRELFEDVLLQILRLAADGPKKILRLDRNGLEALEEKSEDTIMSDFDEGSCTNIVELDIEKPWPKIAYVWINVYSSTRHYGGPEEGGWWYDRFYPEESEMIRVIYDEGGGASVPAFERGILMELIDGWLENYEFGTSYQSSMRPKAADHTIRVEWKQAYDHSNHPGQWC
jgi:hypothetical protein